MARERSELARLRARYLRAALGLANGCAACAAGAVGCDHEVSSYVAAPMSSAPADSGIDAALTMASVNGADAGASLERPLPPEPMTSPRAQCRREVACRREASETPPMQYPEPYALCEPTFDKTTRDSRFSVRETAAARETDAHTCCYVAFRDCVIRIAPVLGRPLRDARGRPRIALVFPTDREPSDPRNDGAARWIRAARHEHASAATFARLALELLACGAPSSLVREANAAAIDELAHAELALSLAEHYGASRLTLGALAPAVVPFGRVSVSRMARAALRDGCVGETAAALAARTEARREPDAPVAAALARIADDEERHAELAWRVVAWAAHVGGGAARRALRAEMRRVEVDDFAPRDITDAIVRPCLDAILRASAASRRASTKRYKNSQINARARSPL